MTKRQFLLLVLISALWGSSFIFMRVLAPLFGPIYTSSIRLLSASLFLFIVFRFTKERVSWKKDWKWLLIIGILNSSIPFTLYAFAALYLPANLSVILNSTAPMFGMIFSVMFLGDKFKLNKIIGLVLGTIGVIIISSVTFEKNSLMLYLSILACIFSASLYGLSGTLVKKYASEIDTRQLTLGSMFFAGLVVLPFGLFTQIDINIELYHIFMIVTFGVLCTATPYLIYYKLLKDIGPVKTLMTTYMMPVFGIVWAYIFLKEAVSVNIVFGLIVILGSIYLITKKVKII